jgi:hypothetical protein
MFLRTGLIRPWDVPRFVDAQRSAMRLRDSVPLEFALIVGVYLLGALLWNYRTPPGVPTWYSTDGKQWDLTAAGFWYVFISIPIFQVILLRWYLRFGIWFRFLWQVARMNLHLVTTNPDHCGGLSFLGKSAYLFGPILFAQGAMVTGVIANRVLNRGDNILDFKAQAGGAVVFLLLIILGPLLVFTPGMLRAKRMGWGDYGAFGSRYVRDFEQKWVDRVSARESPLGSADIQSLADLANSYAIMRDMRFVPFSVRDVINLAAVTAAPLIPLLLTVFPAAELVKRVVKILL